MQMKLLAKTSHTRGIEPILTLAGAGGVAGVYAFVSFVLPAVYAPDPPSAGYGSFVLQLVLPLVFLHGSCFGAWVGLIYCSGPIRAAGIAAPSIVMLAIATLAVWNSSHQGGGDPLGDLLVFSTLLIFSAFSFALCFLLAGYSTVCRITNR